MYLFFSLSGFINAFLATIFGVFFFINREGNKARKNFSFFCFAMAFWSYPYIMWPLAVNKSDVLFWFQILHLGSFFIPTTYFHFVISWLDIYKKNKYALYFAYFLSIFFSLFVFSPYFIKDMVPKFSINFWAVPGVLYHFYLLFFFLYFLYSSFLLLKHYFIARDFKKNQIRILFIGLFISFLGGFTNYFLIYNINILPYSNIFASFYIILSAYAIARHQFMDIKIVLKKSTISLFSFFITFVLSFFLYFILYIFSRSVFITEIFILSFALYIFPLINNFFYKLANKYFSTSLYEPRKVIVEISNILRSTLSLKIIFNSISKIFRDIFKTKYFAIFLFDKEKKYFKLVYNRGFHFKKDISFSAHRNFQKLFKQNKTLKAQFFEENNNGQFQRYIDFFSKNKISLITSLNTKKRIIGYMLFGEKDSGDIYDENDFLVLNIASSQISSAIDNSLLYEELKHFNIKLEEEVDKATQDLKKANLQLKKLDEAKSDFISIASHQLRTPLTVTKGYISMILEGNFGKITKKIKNPLHKVYESNERLINLVEDLLSISRIESGRLVYTFEKKDLKEVLDSTFFELKDSALKKNLKLIYNSNDSKKYLAKIDSMKLRQVFMNLIDNAIKYTYKSREEGGEIKISLSEKNKKILFCVEDNGLGIPKEAMNSLFKKFSRGKGISIVHTNGTGLGLYVAKEIIKAHSGRIWAESEGENKGAKFCFELPSL